jgi:hypothetical protein
MSNQDHYPTEDNSSIRDQIPHSGVHHDETPVQEFDNTSLQDAHEQGLLVTPESPAGLIERTSRYSKKQKFGAAVAVAVVGTGAFLGIKTMTNGGGNDHESTVPSTTTSAPANPGKTDPTQTSGEAEPQARTGDFGISAADFDGNPEILVQEFYKQQNEYFIAGADEKAANADERFQVTMDEYVGSLSAPIDEAFIENMFVKNWDSNSRLAGYVSAIEEIAKTTRRVRLETYSGGTEDKEPYVRETVLDNAVTSVDPLTTSVRWHEQDNRDMNTAEEVLTGVDPNEQVGGETFTWVEEDGLMKISDITHYDG